MELDQLREAAKAVLTELIEQSKERGVKVVSQPKRGSDDEQVLLAYSFRWLWEHAEEVDGGYMQNYRPLMEAFTSALPAGESPEAMEYKLKPLRGHIASMLEDAGLISRPYTRAWKWKLSGPESMQAPDVPLDDEQPALASGVAVESVRRMNGTLPTLGETLTVVGLYLDGDDVKLALRRESGVDVQLTIGN